MIILPIIGLEKRIKLVKEYKERAYGIEIEKIEEEIAEYEKAIKILKKYWNINKP